VLLSPKNVLGGGARDPRTKPKALTTCAEGNTTINTSANANVKEPKPAKVPKSVKVKSQAKDTRTSSFQGKGDH
jgi:hypothetical protein